MAIWFHNKNVSITLKNRRHLKIWISTICDIHNKIPRLINFIFVDKQSILEINTKYLKHEYYTDIISFDYSQGNEISGDIYICSDIVKENSLKFKALFNDELKRVIIHGILHMLGYNDNSPDDIIKMRKAEDNALSYVKDLLIL